MNNNHPIKKRTRFLEGKLLFAVVLIGLLFSIQVGQAQASDDLGSTVSGLDIQSEVSAMSPESAVNLANQRRCEAIATHRSNWSNLCWKSHRTSDTVYVEAIQMILWCQGHFGRNAHVSEVDGDFGNKTYQAVRSFQARHGLQVDGVVGSQTWQALRNQLKVEVFWNGVEWYTVRNGMRNSHCDRPFYYASDRDLWVLNSRGRSIIMHD